MPKTSSRSSITPTPVDRADAIGNVINKRSGYRYALINKGHRHFVDRYRQARYKQVRWDFRVADEKTGEKSDAEGFALNSDGERIPLNPYVGYPDDEARNGDKVGNGEAWLMEILERDHREMVEHGTPGIDSSQGQDRARFLKEQIGYASNIANSMPHIRGTRIESDSVDGIPHGRETREERL